MPGLVPVPVLEPALFAPLVPLEEFGRFAPLVPLVPLGDAVPLGDDDPALFAPLVRSELVRSPVFVRVRSVSVVLVFVLLGRVVGSLLVVLSRVRVGGGLVLVSLLSHPMNAIPPNVNAAANKML